MKDKNYRLDEFIELMNYFGGYIKLKRYIRFKLTPHSPIQKIEELRITDNFSEYGEARDTIIQRLTVIKLGLIDN